MKEVFPEGSLGTMREEQTHMSERLISPHSGSLLNLIVNAERSAELRVVSKGLGFMTRADYESVCSSMRLVNGALWPIPVTLDVPEEVARELGPGATVALRDPEGALLEFQRPQEPLGATRRFVGAAGGEVSACPVGYGQTAFSCCPNMKRTSGYEPQSPPRES